MSREAIEATIAKARRGSATAVTDIQLQRAIGQYFDRALGQTLKDFALIKEKVEVLNGERGNQKDFAVRRSDIVGVIDPPPLQADYVVDEVTVDDYNKLVEDVRVIYLTLAAIVGNLARKGR